MPEVGASPLSVRLREVVEALPLHPGLRVLEIGGAPGAAARAVAAKVAPTGHVLVLDRSARGIALTHGSCRAEIAAGLLSTKLARVEDFTLDVEPFDLAFACRVGALDGRHPHLYERALENIRRVTVPHGTLYLDTGSPLHAVRL